MKYSEWKTLSPEQKKKAFDEYKKRNGRQAHHRLTAKSKRPNVA